MKKLISIVLVLSLVLSMGILSAVSADAQSTTEYLIHKYDRNHSTKAPGEIHGYMGDVDGDNEISIMDATEIQLIMAQLITGTEISSLLADVDGDTQVSIIDSTEIQLYLSELITSDVINHALYTPYTINIKPETGAKLTVWVPQSALSTTKAQCQNFLKQYPQANLKITVSAQSESDAAFELLSNPDTAADVFTFTCDQLSSLRNAYLVRPVPKDLVADIKSRNSSASTKAATISISGIDTLLAYPLTADNGYMLFYDKRYVSDNDAKTIEGIFAACRKAKKKFVMDAGNGFYSCVFPFTGGLRIEGFESSYSDVQKFNNYNEKEVVATMGAFAKLFHDYDDIFLNSSTSRIPSGFASSPTSVAAGIDGTWDAATIKATLGKNFGVAKLPTINVNGKAKQMVSMHGYRLLGVNNKTKYPNAAALLSNYLSGEECQSENVTKLAWGPSNTNAANSDAVKNNPAISAILKQSEYSVAQSQISPYFWEPMGYLGTTLVNGSKYDTTTLTSLLNRTITNIKDI